MKIAVLGNSVAFKVRPPRRSRDEAPFPTLVERRLGPPAGPARVHNLGRFLGMLHHGQSALEQQVEGLDPDVVVLCYGINEAAPRILPRVLVELLSARRHSASRPVRALVKGLDVVVVLVGSVLTRLVSRPWVAPHRFERELDRLVAAVQKETAARCLVLNVPEPTDRVEGFVHGLRDSIPAYNAAVERVARGRGATVVDVHGIVGDQQERLLPDGIHLSAEGHGRVADRIVELLGGGAASGHDDATDGAGGHATPSPGASQGSETSRGPGPGRPGGAGRRAAGTG